MLNKKPVLAAVLLIGAVIAGGIYFSSKSAESSETGDAAEIVVFKSISCGCCEIYANYLKKIDDFDTEVVDLPDISSIKTRYKIPPNLQSCHTSAVGNYFVEGHAPKEAIAKLLKEKPDIAGIALAGMPSGSPGMPGAKMGEFVIYAVGKDGASSVFMRM